jgi:hypothetical protein
MAPSIADVAPTTAQSTSGKGLRVPLKLSGVLDQFESKELTPVIGTEFKNVNLVDWLNAPNSDELLRDLAITSEY